MISSHASGLSVGANVEICSLVSTPEYNTVLGQIVTYDANKGRWGVQIATDGRILSLKTANLTLQLSVNQVHVLTHALYGPRGAGNWDEMATLESELRELAIDVEAGRPDVTAFIYETLGQCYFKLKDYEKAIAFWEKALAIVQNRSWIRPTYTQATHMGGLIQNLGDCYQKQSSFLKAIELFEQAQAIAEGAGDSKDQGAICVKLGECYFPLEQYTQCAYTFCHCLSASLLLSVSP